MPTADVVGTSSENKYGTEYLYYLKHDCDSQYTHTFSNIKITCIYLNYLSLCKILPLSAILITFLLLWIVRILSTSLHIYFSNLNSH